MTVGDPISASSLGPNAAAPPSNPGGPAGPEPVNAAAAVAAAAAARGGAVAAGGGSSGAGAPAGTHNPMAIKVNHEVLTSLHLIKDIRRLEKYQRDFFLKVSWLNCSLGSPVFQFKFNLAHEFCSRNNSFVFFFQREGKNAIPEMNLELELFWSKWIEGKCNLFLSYLAKKMHLHFRGLGSFYRYFLGLKMNGFELDFLFVP